MEDDQSRPESREEEVLEEIAEVLSHDLSNLLVTAHSSLELARRNQDSEQIKRTAAILDNAGELVDDVVTLARTGQQLDNVDLTDLAEIAERAWLSVAESEASLTIDTAAEVRADPSNLRLLLENLFRNAVEHGRADATVKIGVIQRAGDEGFYVADNGNGFTLTETDRAFESGFSTGEKQTGFGLAIVKRIVNAHGWTISVTDSWADGARIEITDVDVVSDSPETTDQ